MTTQIHVCPNICCGLYFNRCQYCQDDAMHAAVRALEHLCEQLRKLVLK